MADEIIRALLGEVKPPERGFTVESQAKARRGGKFVSLRVWDLDAPWKDQRGNFWYTPHPQSPWYDLEKPLVARHKGFSLIFPGLPHRKEPA